MQERLRYKNHMNEIIDFGAAGIYVCSNDLHNYSWEVSQKNNRISSFRRTVATRTLPVVIFCTTADQGIAARNRLMEVAEKDVLAMKPGQIIIGDYYFECYITASTKERYLASRREMEAKLTLTSDKPYWVRETAHTLRYNSGQLPGFEYAFDYPIDLTSRTSSDRFVNTDFTASNFRMIIYGPCSSPTVYISGHAYGMNCDAQEGEHIIIDSVAKTAKKVAIDGSTTNVFNLRNRESYIFEKIQPGSNQISWTGDFNVDLILLEERSEPRWT